MNSKIAIDKKLHKIKSSDLFFTHKEIEKAVRFINKGLVATVLFRDITISEKTKLKAHSMFNNLRVIDTTTMPFNDVAILMDLDYEDKDGKTCKLNNGMIMRFTKFKEISNILFNTTYVLLQNGKDWILTGIKAYDLDTGNFDVVAYDKNLSYIIEEGKRVNEYPKEMAAALTHLLALMSYEPEIIKTDLTFSERKHIPSGMKDKYIEYTLDLSKPIKRRLFKSLSKGGSHASPCEHKRRGHWRTYKSGKRTWVDGITVNKGSSSGIVEKDYSMGS